MIETPQIIETTTVHVASIHIVTPRSKMQLVMGPGIGEVMSVVKAQGVGPSGPWFAHHLKMTTDEFDFDICIPVSVPVSALGRVKPWVRPALKVVRTVYCGPYEGLGAAWHEFSAWIETNGYRTADDLYECYLAGPESSSDSSTWRTELSRALV